MLFRSSHSGWVWSGVLVDEAFKGYEGPGPMFPLGGCLGFSLVAVDGGYSLIAFVCELGQLDLLNQNFPFGIMGVFLTVATSRGYCKAEKTHENAQI